MYNLDIFIIFDLLFLHQKFLVNLLFYVIMYAVATARKKIVLTP